jgi:TolB protein
MALSSKFFRVAVVLGAALLATSLVALVAAQRPAEASFPGNNGLIAFFYATDDNDDWEIFTKKLDGSSLKQRTNAEGSSRDPSWSPDGTKIAFASNRNGQNYEIYVKDITTGKVSQLTDTVRPPSARGLAMGHPVWSPDGTKIAYNQSISYWDYWCSDMFVMGADGSDAKELNGGCDLEYVEAWSPDGTKIAFTRAFYDYPYPRDIWVMKPDGSEQRNLTNTPWQFDEREVDWKPNGRKLVYTREPNEEIDFQNQDVWKMSPDGSHKDRLTFSEPDEHSPLWSPNGRKILFLRPCGDYRMCEPSLSAVMMDIDGTNKKDIPGSVFGYDFDWQPVPTP